MNGTATHEQNEAKDIIVDKSDALLARGILRRAYSKEAIEQMQKYSASQTEYESYQNLLIETEKAISADTPKFSANGLAFFTSIVFEVVQRGQQDGLSFYDLSFHDQKLIIDLAVKFEKKISSRGYCYRIGVHWEEPQNSFSKAESEDTNENDGKVGFGPYLSD